MPLLRLGLSISGGTEKDVKRSGSQFTTMELGIRPALKQPCSIQGTKLVPTGSGGKLIWMEHPLANGSCHMRKLGTPWLPCHFISSTLRLGPRGQLDRLKLATMKDRTPFKLPSLQLST